METKTEYNLYEKLHIIQSRIISLRTDSQSFGYKYLSGVKLLDHIKPLMNEFGLLLKQEVLSIDNTRIDYTTKNGAKTEILSKVMMKFTWIDCVTGDTDENLFGANGQNDFEKGLGSALTYGERYFLLKYFHISTDEDDIDNPNRQTALPILTDAQIESAITKGTQAKVLEGNGKTWNLTEEQIIKLKA